MALVMANVFALVGSGTGWPVLTITALPALIHSSNLVLLTVLWFPTGCNFFHDISRFETLQPSPNLIVILSPMTSHPSIWRKKIPPRTLQILFVTWPVF